MTARDLHDNTTAPVPPPAPVGLELVVLAGGADRAVALPAAGALVIGRSASCELVIDDPSVSRRHARLHLMPLAIEGLGEVNPVTVRGQRLAPGARAPLAPGEVVELGRALVYVRAAETAVVPVAPPAIPPELVVIDPAMLQLHALCARIAVSRVPVVILGETGVGKEHLAEAIHRASPRAAGPLVKVNGGALPPNLIEAELFGHEKGAFTGADRRAPGRLEEADGGTLFLDEVGELPPAAQAALLRVLEDGVVRPIGARAGRPVDVRLVSATNRDLAAEVAAGRFRADLFYRLRGIAFTVPPLRDRPTEIAPLARRFAAAAGAAGMTPAAVAALTAHRWPGNIRELRHAIEAAAALAGGARIDVAHLPILTAAAQLPPAAPRGELRDRLAAVERARIIDALRAAAGNQTRAAAALGVSRRTLLRRLAAHGIPHGRRIPDDG